jgi:hypothetical protein
MMSGIAQGMPVETAGADHDTQQFFVHHPSPTDSML